MFEVIIVTIRYALGVFASPMDKNDFGWAVHAIVKQELHIERSIEIRFEEARGDDICAHVLEIHIEAMASPERVASRADIVKFISMRMREDPCFPKMARSAGPTRRPFVRLVLLEMASEDV